MIRCLILYVLLIPTTGLSRPLPFATRPYDAVTLNRASRQFTLLRSLIRPDNRPMVVTHTLVQPTISFLVNSAAAYNTGVTLANQNTLNVSYNVGSGTYVLSVRANSANLTSGINTIPVGQITIQLVTINAGAVAGTLRTLSTVDQTLITYPYTGAAFTGQRLGLTYRLLPGNALLRPAGTYSTTITYTITGP